jgi:glycerophosphoryl diester phosphodiesterase
VTTTVLRTVYPTDSFDSEVAGVPLITRAGVAVDDTKVAAVQTAATHEGVTLVSGGVAGDTTGVASPVNQLNVTTTYPGPPTSGTYVKGQLSTDSNAVSYICTTSGTPGVWQANARLPFRLATDGPPAPVYIPHRGGAARFPEESMEGWRYAASRGWFVDTDVQVLSDGTLVCCHDATVDRTMTGTGNVSSFDRAGWRALRLKPKFPGQRYAAPVEWEQLATTFGGHVPITVECKASAALTPLLTSIARHGLHNSVIFCSFTWTDIQAARALGITAAWISDTPVVSDLTAAGCAYHIVSTSALTSVITACNAAGIKVLSFTPNTRAAAAAEIARGAWGVFSDSAEWVGQLNTAQDADPYGDGVSWPGHIITGTGLAFRGRELALPKGAGGAISSLQSWAGNRGPNLRVRFKLRFGSAATATTKYVYCYMGTLAEDTTFSVAGTAGQNGYAAAIHRDGQLQINWLDTTGATGNGSQTTVPGTPIAAASSEGEALIEFEQNATQVVLRNLTTGLSTTWANTGYRSAASRVAFSVDGTDAYISDVTVTDI